ncbi:MAG: helix-turn-helix domain-containing protein [Candidatus Adiutrix sp.]|jgi:excisionase family DNA binding protein|nr:helix-turn-helix domain-containing protein [Candidatus Adiutrix sp.]
MALSEDEKIRLAWLKHESRKGGSRMAALTDEERAERPLTVDEAAEFLKVNRSTVLKWLKEGKIRAAKIGREWRIKKAEIDRLLNGE